MVIMSDHMNNLLLYVRDRIFGSVMLGCDVFQLEVRHIFASIPGHRVIRNDCNKLTSVAAECVGLSVPHELHILAKSMLFAISAKLPRAHHLMLCSIAQASIAKGHTDCLPKCVIQMVCSTAYMRI